MTRAAFLVSFRVLSFPIHLVLTGGTCLDEQSPDGSGRTPASRSHDAADSFMQPLNNPTVIGQVGK